MGSPADTTLAANRRRLVTERLAKYGVTFGGVMVLVTLLMLVCYLLYVIVPLFRPATATKQDTVALSHTQTLALGVSENAKVTYRIDTAGDIRFRDVMGKPLARFSLGQPIIAAASAISSEQTYALATARGVVVVKPTFEPQPALSYPFGQTPRAVVPAGHQLQQLTLAVNDKEATVVALDKRGQSWLSHLGSGPQKPQLLALNVVPERFVVSSDQQHLFVQYGQWLSVYQLSPFALRLRLKAASGSVQITAMTLLAGGYSILLGRSDGSIGQWFSVLTNNGQQVRHIRDFQLGQPVVALASEYYRRGFAASGSRGAVSLFQATSERKLLALDDPDGAVYSLAYAPKGNGLLLADGKGLRFYQLDNPHPEISWKALWGDVWYEGYPRPERVWQSTSGSDDFEPKLSLAPLTFGTLKAAFYAMLFATPLALAGAIYTAYFMSERLRRLVKPTVELMEALPTVILGFLAGLWLAPLIESHLPSVLALLVLLPVSVLISAGVWHVLPESLRQRLPEGWQVLVLIPPLLLAGWLSMALGPWLEQVLFGGDSRLYLTDVLGMGFDQRNALVVGVAMGFAVIPTIFTIAEDAVHAVPRHLTQGSLALGATPWQTLTRVVLLTASPGIFSAVMMGIGRAVGETMIVLMASGNTPLMKWNLFEGMRTLSANIAVEMGESEVGSTHYRVLFLAAFVLFVFTFIFNTIAELVRQRLRQRYRSL